LKHTPMVQTDVLLHSPHPSHFGISVHTSYKCFTTSCHA